jgi:hypothetical protein
MLFSFEYFIELSILIDIFDNPFVFETFNKMNKPFTFKHINIFF